jgi:hypothetical protein
VQTIIALLFCLALDAMVKAQGWFALVWVSLDFLVELFVTARIALPILLGLPRGIRLVGREEMRAAVFRRLLFTPVLWIVQLAAIVFLVEFFWPSAAAWFERHDALSTGLWLGVLVSCCPGSRQILVRTFTQTLTGLIGSFTSVAPRVEDVTCPPTGARGPSDLPPREKELQHFRVSK